MINRNFTFIDDHIKDVTIYFANLSKGKCIAIGKDYTISVCGLTSFPASYNGPYYTALIGDDRFISQDLLKLSSFIKEKFDDQSIH